MRDAINNAATDSDNDGNKDALASIIYDGSNYMLMLKVNLEQVMKLKLQILIVHHHMLMILQMVPRWTKELPELIPHSPLMVYQ